MMLEHQVRGILYSTWYHRPPRSRRRSSRPTSCSSTASPRAARRPPSCPTRCRAAAPPPTCSSPPDTVASRSSTPPPPRPRTTAACGGTGRHSRQRVSRSTSRSCSMRAPSRRAATTPSRRSLDRGATAVFCHNDRVAMGLYDGLRERGLSHPGGHRGGRLRQPGSHRRPPSPAAHDGRPAALRARRRRRADAARPRGGARGRPARGGVPARRALVDLTPDRIRRDQRALPAAVPLHPGTQLDERPQRPGVRRRAATTCSSSTTPRAPTGAT